MSILVADVTVLVLKIIIEFMSYCHIIYCAKMQIFFSYISKAPSPRQDLISKIFVSIEQNKIP